MANEKEVNCLLAVAYHCVWANENQIYDASTMTKHSKNSYISAWSVPTVAALFTFNMTCRVVVNAAPALP
jgi:hypothetical protein